MDARCDGRRPLRLSFLLAAAAGAVPYGALFVVSQSGALGLAPTTILERWAWLRAVAGTITPRGMAGAEWGDPRTTAQLAMLGAVAVVLVATWVWMLWTVRPGAYRLRTRDIVVLVAAYSLPLLAQVNLFSSDVYLYAFYGREIAVYGENPFLVIPLQFSGDPHLEPVFWSWLPSAYGPVWMLFSGAVSWMAGDDLLLAVLLFKGALLALHLATTMLVGRLVARHRPDAESWAMVFYGLNPLVLFEVVGNAHNDGAVTFLIVAALATMVTRWPLVAIAVLAAAVMTKAPVVVLVGPVAVAILVTRSGLRHRVGAALVMAAVFVATALALYAPLWAGRALLDNIRRNPASMEFHNSVWQWVRELAGVGDVAVSGGERLLLTATFVAVLLAVVHGVWRRRPLWTLLAWTWMAYCASLPWVWPWYLVPGVALAALSGPGSAAAMTAALTTGGLLFWTGWQPPGVPSAQWLFEIRALLMFGPAIALGVLPLLADAAAAASAFGTVVAQALVERTRERRPLSSADADA